MSAEILFDLPMYHFLAQYHLQQYYEILVTNHMTLDALPTVQHEKLIEFGISSAEDRQTLLAAASTLSISQIPEDTIVARPSMILDDCHADIPFDLVHPTFSQDGFVLPTAQPEAKSMAVEFRLSEGSQLLMDVLETMVDTKHSLTFTPRNETVPQYYQNCPILHLMSPNYSISLFAATTDERMMNGTLRRLVPVQKQDRKRSLESDLPYRAGRWTTEEVAYVELLITEFEAGILPLTNGTMLRMFIAAVLNCDRMRVSKKFAKRGPRKKATDSMGKHVFRRNENAIQALTTYEIEQKRERLVAAEIAFLNRVYSVEIEASASFKTHAFPVFIGWHTYNPKTNPLIAYFGEFRSEHGGRVSNKRSCHF